MIVLFEEIQINRKRNTPTSAKESTDPANNILQQQSKIF